MNGRTEVMGEGCYGCSGAGVKTDCAPLICKAAESNVGQLSVCRLKGSEPISHTDKIKLKGLFVFLW